MRATTVMTDVPAKPIDEEEDAMQRAIAKLPSPRRHERWFDLCFRLILLALAGFWLFVPPAGGAQISAQVKADIAKR